MKSLYIFAATFVVGFSVVAFNATSQEVQQVNEQTEEVEKELIPVVVKKDVNATKVEANLSDLKPAGLEIGIHNMVIEGSKVETQLNDGTTKVEIVWEGAYLIKEDGEKKQTSFFEPLTSAVAVNPSLSEGDKFTAEGNSMEVLLAWERLNAEDEEVTEEEEEQQTVENSPSSQGGAGGSEQGADPVDFQAPEFTDTEAPNIVTTTDGCSVNVDIAQEVAIVQERVLEDGVEIQACSDTLTRYPLKQSYAACPLSFDMPNMLAYEQYTTYYTDPEGSGDIQVQDCTPDNEQIIALVSDTSGCSIRDDFPNNVSIQQAQITYDYQGATQTLQGCTDTATTYPHVEVTDVCNAIVDEAGGTVSFQSRFKITVDSVDQYVTDCAPDGNSVAILEEACTGGQEFTHDFDTDQSFLNKTYYYMDGADRVDVITCQPSITTYAHMEDQTVCTALNDDVNRETTINAKTYIERTPGDVVFISSCQGVLPTVPYTYLGGMWRSVSTNSSNITVNSDDDTVTTATAGQLNWTGDGFSYIEDPSNIRWSIKSSCDAIGGSTKWVTGRVSGKKYCLRGSLGVGYTAGGITIDTINSTEAPSFSTTISQTGYTYNAYNTSYGMNLPVESPLCDYRQYGTGTYSCSIPSCTLNQLEKNPHYLRGDATNYTDISVNEESKYICGSTSPLIGTVE